MATRKLHNIVRVLGTWLLLVAPGSVSACTLLWDAVTTHTDGSPIVGTVTYRVYFKANGTTKADAIAETSGTRTTMLCPAGQYWVTGFGTAPGDDESGPSNTVVVLQRSPVINFRAPR